LVSGVPPIRAKKARYFEDPRLTERVLPPPQLKGNEPPAEPIDDWGRLPIPAVVDLASAVNASGEGHVDDPANAGVRREPELPEYEEIAPEHANPTPEFTFGEKESDDDAVRARALRQQARGLARQAAMDPGDGMEL
jgi:type IV secretion system protein VirD4